MKLIKSFSIYLGQSVQELKKVAWPSRTDLTRYLITIIISLMLAIGVIALVDYGLSRLVKIIFKV